MLFNCYPLRVLIGTPNNIESRRDEGLVNIVYTQHTNHGRIKPTMQCLWCCTSNLITRHLQSKRKFFFLNLIVLQIPLTRLQLFG